MNSIPIYYEYKKARKKFSIKTYVLLIAWLFLALIQWLMVSFVSDINIVFFQYYSISIVMFLLAILLFALFLFLEKIRFKKPVAIVLTILIVEFQIISLFALVARSYWKEMLLYFFICVILTFICVGIGIVLPRKMDLTLHVALLFILAFLFLLVAFFFLMLHLHIFEMTPNAYILVQIPISSATLLFVMYHAQTIHGGRFAEMRLHDFCLASLIIFHDFLLIYWLTFYWQISGKLLTPTNWAKNTTQYANSMNVREDYVNGFNRKMIINDSWKVIHRLETTTNCGTTDLSITLDFMKDDMDLTATSSSRKWG